MKDKIVFSRLEITQIDIPMKLHSVYMNYVNLLWKSNIYFGDYGLTEKEKDVLEQVVFQIDISKDGGEVYLLFLAEKNLLTDEMQKKSVQICNLEFAERVKECIAHDLEVSGKSCDSIEDEVSFEQSEFIIIENDGQDIIQTNYWESDFARRGFCYLSTNAGAFRLLVPDNKIKFIDEFQTGKYCIISQGPSKPFLKDKLFKLLFEDFTETPYHLILSPGLLDRCFTEADSGSKCILSVWKNYCEKVMTMDAYLRTVENIPCLKPLDYKKNK